ncbi:ribosomal protein L7/L12 [Brachybacterium sacelli]|uniref:Ribosomal protein L7/L12 n=1 Tax=Brachybacterium sacelli TaxID=173364 RepID=A0ABS4WX90_9MICO|nr:ribosomal protein L7/L12 [Brachybacterium sacelli]MBP2380778.1 ribosomal protein L7/L12 [Brachybacterium sacelli]
MFGRSRQQQVHIDSLQAQIRDLEGLVDVLAARADIGQEELLRLRGEVGPNIPAESRRLVAEGKDIAAIKVYREHTGAGLKEAKDAIDQYRAGLA